MTGQARIVIAESTGAKPSLTDLTLKKDALYPLNITAVPLASFVMPERRRLLLIFMSRTLIQYV
ncbi:MAG: hypothetical protein IIB73_11925 [Proteobacteria bacterium]|nr:hypothetical protein [Pseudomonadota bacterium]